MRWVAIGALILFGAVLYFRAGRQLAPLTAPAASPVAPDRPSAN
ncbi:MAG TPA: hypothetical protein VFU41_11370 [Gemmatimonadales bacterium]|nr:hypothetical protein [Gemmatimonadales bacterium]